MLFGMRTCGNTGLELATCPLGSERCNRVSKRGRDMTEFEGKHMGAASKAQFWPYK